MPKYHIASRPLVIDYPTAARPRGWWEYLPDNPIDAAAPVVMPSEPVNTGLVDHRGTPIWRMPEQIGFPITKEG